jgi:hypothetical protein
MTASAKRSGKRSGTTKNVSVSLEPDVLKMLRDRADSMHGGNLSAAIAEAAATLHRQAAAQYVAAELMKGRAPLTDAERAQVDAELEEGWALARKVAVSKSKRQKNAA